MGNNFNVLIHLPLASGAKERATLASGQVECRVRLHSCTRPQRPLAGIHT
ncbi:MAG: hypothetical protein RIR79_757 [Pseudomonadota bacterium]|jgi:hypothetical protein